jgi:hypothetical protein
MAPNHRAFSSRIDINSLERALFSITASLLARNTVILRNEIYSWPSSVSLWCQGDTKLLAPPEHRKKWKPVGDPGFGYRVLAFFSLSRGWDPRAPVRHGSVARTSGSYWRSRVEIFACKQTMLIAAFREFPQLLQANYVTDASFYILSNSLFTNSTLYTVWYSDVNEPCVCFLQ